MVGFLLSQLGYVVARRFGATMAELELEPRHFAVLEAVAADEGQAQSTLGERLHIPASSMVSLLDHLEQRGLLVRRVHRTDRRSRTVHLTADGRELAERATIMAMDLEQRLCAGLSAQQRLELIGRLQLVGRNLDVIEGVHPAMAAGHGDGGEDKEGCS